MTDLVSLLRDLALQYGYLGVLGASIAGSVIPFVPVPYLIIVILLSGNLNPLALGLLAGLGGAIGKTTSYLLGRWGYLVADRGTKQNLEFMGRFIGKYGDLGVFVFAVTPLPDDIYMIPIGMVKFPYWRFLLANVLGKVILSTAVAYFGGAYFVVTEEFFGSDSAVILLLLITLTGLVSFLLARADWFLAYSKYKDGGVREVLRGLPEVLGMAKPRTGQGA